MKVLLIAYLYPPFQDPQALRWYYLSNSLCEKGCDVDVITIQNPLRDHFLNYHPKLRIHRVYAGPVETPALRKRASIEAGSRNDGDLRHSIRFKILKAGYKAFKFLLSSFIPGDIRTEWLPFAVRYITKNVNFDEYDWVITSHEPWVDSLLGLYLKKRFRIRWIADFGDPYVAPYTPRHKLLIEKRIEKAVYENADVLIFTNRHVKEYLEKKYEFLSEKPTIVIYQGFSKFIMDGRRTGYEKPMEDGCLNIFYAGTFYEHFRDPVPLFRALSSLKKDGFRLRLYVAGRNEKFLKYSKDSQGSIKFLGFIPHTEVPRYLAASNLLLCVTNRMRTQIPGKFFEYLGTSKPILCISYDLDNEIIKIMREYKRGWVCINEKSEIEKTLRIIYEIWEKKGDNLGLKLNPVPMYSYDLQAEKLIQTLESLKHGV